LVAPLLIRFETQSSYGVDRLRSTSVRCGDYLLVRVQERNGTPSFDKQWHPFASSGHGFRCWMFVNAGSRASACSRRDIHVGTGQSVLRVCESKGL